MAVLQLTPETIEPISDDLRQDKYSQSFGIKDAWTKADSFGQLRPVKNTLFFLRHELNAPWVFFRLAGLLWLLPTLYLFYAILIRIGLSNHLVWPALIWWCFLPVTLEMVVWASAINVGFHILFLLLVFWLFIKSEQGSQPGWCLLGGAMAHCAALSSYELALTIPLLLLVLKWDGWEKQYFQKSMKNTLYWFMTLGGLNVVFLLSRRFLVADIAWQMPSNSYISPGPDWQLIASSFYSYLWHLKELFNFSQHPVFHVDLDISQSWFLSVILFCLAALISMFFHKMAPDSRSAVVRFALFSFFGLLPVINLIPIRAGPLQIIYTAIPSIGCVLFLFPLLANLSTRRSWPKWIAPTLIWLLVFAALPRTFGLRDAWANPNAFWPSVLESNQSGHLARVKYALMTVSEDTAESIELIYDAIERAPWDPLSYQALGYIFRSIEDLDSLEQLEIIFRQRFPEETFLHEN